MFANVWESVASSVETKINQQSFSTWFRPITYSHSTESSIFVKVPNQLFVDWICSNFSEVLQESLIEQGLRDQKLQFLIDESVAAHAAAAAASVGGRLESRLNDDELRFSDSLSSTRLVDLEPLELPLNQKYTFESFVVGSCNQFAHAAALAVATNPSRMYNPLYLYGGVGMGKTHLMQAIGRELKANFHEIKVLYISSEQFMNEMIHSLRYDRMTSFHERFRSVDALLVDDIQILGTKERTQEEFFHTFNTLYELQKQIVISSDCPPKEIPGLVDRLSSRFEWGLIADIQPPDLETKMAILDRKAEEEGIHLPEDVRAFMATKMKSNVRELEGAFIRLLALSSLTGVEISLAMAQQALKSI